MKLIAPTRQVSGNFHPFHLTDGAAHVVMTKNVAFWAGASHQLAQQEGIQGYRARGDKRKQWNLQASTR